MADPISILGDSAAPYAYIGGGRRKIGTIIPDVVLEEEHDDQLAITDHPIESGGTATDHSFLLPTTLTMRCAFSNSTAGSEGYVQKVYQEILALQAQRTPFDVSTGKRQYKNMMIRGIQVRNDVDSENALNIVVMLRGVQFVYTQMYGGTANNGASPSPNPADHSEPQSTTPTQQTGFTPITQSQQSLPYFASGQAGQPNPYSAPTLTTPTSDTPVAVAQNPFGNLSGVSFGPNGTGNPTYGDLSGVTFAKPVIASTGAISTASGGKW